MIITNITNKTPVPSVPHASAPAPAPGAQDGTRANFAALLRQNQSAGSPAASRAPEQRGASVAARADAPPPAQSAQTDATGSPDTTAESNRGTGRTKARGADKPAASAKAASAAKSTEPPADPASDARSREDESAGKTGTAQLDPAMAQWLAGLNLPPPGTPAAKTGGRLGQRDGSTAPGDALDPAAISADGGDAKSTGRRQTVPGLKSDDDEDGGHRKGETIADAKDTPFATALAEKLDAETKEQTKGLASAAPLASAAESALQSAAPELRTDRVPTAVDLPTPVHAPEFAEALGVQISVLAQDGVQQAELHLNPAEMGPVSVHIVMDGMQARVDFGADLPATRQLIDAGMPELASALRDAGFTLTGGGVSQHAGSRGDGGAEDEKSGARTRRVAGTESADASEPARPLRRTVSAGGLDLYA
jgi:flagellar hook-length control protein FliK